MNLLHIMASGLGGGGGIDAYIKSLNPIFYIKDLTQVVDGYFVDSSGNNKQLLAGAVPTLGAANQYFYISMPANDTQIITILTAAGLYGYFYTDDSTPKIIAIGNILCNYSNYLFFSGKELILFDNLSAEDTKKILNYFKFLDNDFLSRNLIKPFNQFETNKSSIIQGSASLSLTFVAAPPLTYIDNTHINSVTKKTLNLEIINSTQTVSLLGVGSRWHYKDFALGFWINKTMLPTTGTQLAISLKNSANVGPAVSISKANMNANYTATSGVLSAKVVAISGDWAYIQSKWFIQKEVTQNPVLQNFAISVQINYGPIGSNYNVQFSDIVMLNSSDDIDRAKNYDGVEVLSNKFIGKRITYVGDSITVGEWGDICSMLLGVQATINAGWSGARMYNNSVNNWIPANKELIASTPTDYIVIAASANDGGSPIGTVDDEVTSTYLGGYKYFIEYLLANTTAKIVLVTQPFIIGDGYTVPQGKTIYEQQFINMANGVKALGAKYNLPVIDNHGLTRMNYTNCQIYLTDSVHWSRVMAYETANIVAKHLIDNVTL